MQDTPNRGRAQVGNRITALRVRPAWRRGLWCDRRPRQALLWHGSLELIEPLGVYIAGGLPSSYWSFYGTFLLQVRGVDGVVCFLAVLLLFDLLYAGWRGLTRHRRSASERLGPLPSSPAIAGFIFALGLVAYRRNWFAFGYALWEAFAGVGMGLLALVTLPLCFLISLAIRKIPLVNRVL